MRSLISIVKVTRQIAKAKITRWPLWSRIWYRHNGQRCTVQYFFCDPKSFRVNWVIYAPRSAGSFYAMTFHRADVIVSNKNRARYLHIFTIVAFPSKRHFVITGNNFSLRPFIRIFLSSRGTCCRDAEWTLFPIEKRIVLRMIVPRWV